jgi:hypothetical protein
MAAERSFGEVTKNGYGFRSILSAIERLLLMRRDTLPNSYQANYEGITRALWDLGTLIAELITDPPYSTIGPWPPGWNISTGDYKPGQAPGDGSFWFDTRQGRLLVAKDKQWHQTNGAESFVHLGPTPPHRQAPGALWFCTLDGRLYLYIDQVTASGEPGWYEMAGGPTGGGGLQLLDQLIDVDSAVVDIIPAAFQGALLMRDNSVGEGLPGAWKASSRIDLGEYGATPKQQS